MNFNTSFVLIEILGVIALLTIFLINRKRKQKSYVILREELINLLQEKCEIGYVEAVCVTEGMTREQLIHNIDVLLKHKTYEMDNRD